ncbi:MAG: 1-acyl-sn-glycerol-3-phosphate acyltransferase [Cyclobacteriaceae bacterium]|jgi:1-acyl-sn-glycerol-3-phosphate acyltransferase|nr:1-acyl-sn-glycerol-3-phosphate acyltransferase [Cyclobacteriaceae bacterium]
MKLLRALHTYYGFVLFTVVFILLFPFFLIPILFPKQFKLVGVINRWWGYLLFPITFLPYKVECRARLDPKRQYVFCPNHFSYLDIAALGLNPINAVFVGKNDMEKIPLFGFMYRKLHITVDRSKLKSRMNTILKSLQAIDDGKSLVIFPEGGIVSKNPPRMTPFKDGAFRAAIQKQIPIVPVSLPNNWIILPDKQPMRLHRGLIHVIFHEPIETIGYTLDQLEDLKTKVFNVIATELKNREN